MKRDTEELDDDVEKHSQRSEELQNVNEQIRFFCNNFFTFHFDNYSLFCNHFEWEVLAVALELKFFVFFRKYVGMFICEDLVRNFYQIILSPI